MPFLWVALSTLVGALAGWLVALAIAGPLSFSPVAAASGAVVLAAVLWFLAWLTCFPVPLEKYLAFPLLGLTGLCTFGPAGFVAGWLLSLAGQAAVDSKRFFEMERRVTYGFNLPGHITYDQLVRRSLLANAMAGAGLFYLASTGTGDLFAAFRGEPQAIWSHLTTQADWRPFAATAATVGFTRQILELLAQFLTATGIWPR